jgi:hypothetical protein
MRQHRLNDWHRLTSRLPRSTASRTPNSSSPS